MKILFLGDIVGQPGRHAVREKLGDLVASESIDYVIANGENAAGGSGITPSIASELYQMGIDAITMGDHLWKQKDVVQLLENDSKFFRPLNYPEGTSGRGAGVVSKVGKPGVGVINIQGRTFMAPLENPFNLIEQAVESLKQEVSVVVVDFHAEATSEKIAMGWMLDGKVSLMVGTHTHVQTADERVLPKGTGYITDLGFCGGHHGVIGREVEPVIYGFKTLSPKRFPVAKGDVRLHGIIAEIDDDSGACLNVSRVSSQCRPSDTGESKNS